MTDLRKSKNTEEQIIGFLKQAEAGMPVKDLCRKGGFSEAGERNVPVRDLFERKAASYRALAVAQTRPVSAFQREADQC